MDAKIFYDTLECAARLCDARAEVPIETEILIPDYLPQVFKIVKCFAFPVVLHKQPAAGRLTLEGYLRCVVFYQAEQDQALCTAEQKLPFSKVVELPEYQGQWVNVTAAGEVEYLNCRAVNQRRIDIRGACVLTVRATAQQDCQVVTALAEAGLEQKLASLESLQQVGLTDKLITAEEEVRFDQPPQSVLQITGSAAIQEVKLVSGKAVVKGQVRANVLYTAGGNLLEEEKLVPFSQILDMDGVDEDCSWGGWAEVTGCALLAAAGEAGESLSVSVLLHLQAWRMARRSLVTDAFSTQYETVLERQAVTTSTLQARLCETVSASCEGQLPDEGAQVLVCLGTVCPPELAPDENGGCLLRGRAVAHIICLNSLGELECYDRACEYQLPQGWDCPPEQLDLSVGAALVSATARKEGGEAQAKLEIQLSGAITRRSQTQLVTGVECGQEWPGDPYGVALRIYYAQAGEDVFDIASRYHASPAAILQAAGLEEPVLPQAARLLIPVTG